MVEDTKKEGRKVIVLPVIKPQVEKREEDSKRDNIPGRGKKPVRDSTSWERRRTIRVLLWKYGGDRNQGERKVQGI